jgi:PAS domain S-box-containing protein
MKRDAFRNKALAVRNVSAGACCIAVLILLAVGGRHAGRAVLPALGALVGLAALSLYFIFRTVKERRRAEDDLEELQRELDRRVEQRTAELESVSERYVRTLDQMLAGCQLIDFDWRYLYVNDAVVGHGRKSREEMLGRTMAECYPGIENTSVFAVLRDCMVARTIHHVENEFTYPDGSTGWFEISVQPAPEGIFIVSIDITERKRAVVENQRQVARLQSLRAIDLAILETTDTRLALKTVLHEACARLQAEGANILLFNPETMMLGVAAITGDCGAERERVAVRLGEGIAGKAALERRTLSGMEGRHLSYATPLVAKGRLVGALNLTLRPGFVADADWLDFFETVAGQAAMAIDNGKLFEDVQRAMLDLRLAYDTTIEGWSRTLDLRDKETEGHTLRVTEMTVELARLAGMSEAQLMNVKRGALLHDIGKMGVPDHILLKPGKLTDEEWVHMRKHPTYAYELLKPIAYLSDALDIPYCHHEKWDGSGYPRGLKGEDIPLAARIFAVVDVWDAIRSDRPYRKGWDEEKSLDFIRAASGSHFDPKAVDLFLRAMNQKKTPRPVEHLVER